MPASACNCDIDKLVSVNVKKESKKCLYRNYILSDYIHQHHLLFAKMRITHDEIQFKD